MFETLYKKIKTLYFYPLFLVLFPILSIYVHNSEQLRFNEVVSSLAITLLVGIAILLLVNLAIKNRAKAAAIVSIFFILFFSYGHAMRVAAFVLDKVNRLEQVKFLVRGDFAQNLWLVLWTVLFIAACVLILKTREDLRLVNRVLSILAYAAFLSVCGTWIVKSLQQPNNAIQAYTDTWKNQLYNQASFPTTKLSDESLPDIYYIIVDGLGSKEILEDYYQLDTDEIYNEFESKGFYIADQSTSNYAFTELSITSSLNSIYLDQIPEIIGTKTANSMPLQVMMENNSLFHRLRNHGYQVITFADEYYITDITSADIYMSPAGWISSGFQNEVLYTTPLPLVIKHLTLKSSYDQHRDRIIFTLEKLPEASQVDGPVFVFAHILAPHPPFVFAADGTPITPDYNYSLNDGVAFRRDASLQDYIQGYRGQTQFILTRLISAVDDILVNSQEPPIIIIQGDHGPGSMLDWLSLENSNLNERMSITNMYYFPDKDYSGLYETITPVNTFRVVLEEFFDENIDKLPDKNYFTTIDKPYLFRDVTRRVISQ